MPPQLAAEIVSTDCFGFDTRDLRFLKSFWKLAETIFSFLIN